MKIMMIVSSFSLKVAVIMLLLWNFLYPGVHAKKTKEDFSGNELFKQAEKLLEQRKFQKSKDLFLIAMESDSFSLSKDQDGEDIINSMIPRFRNQGAAEYGYLLIAEILAKVGNIKLARETAHGAIEANPRYAEPYVFLAEKMDHDVDLYRKYFAMEPFMNKALEYGADDPKILQRVGTLLGDVLIWDKAESLYSESWNIDPSFENRKSLASAIFMRNHVCKWGRNGSLYAEDMQSIVDIITAEEKRVYGTGGIDQASVFNPANLLGYEVPPKYKLLVAQSFSTAEQYSATRVAGFKPINHKQHVSRHVADARKTGFRIRVGYVSANIKSRTTSFMGQNVLEFHDKSKFEVHVYATTPPDTEDMLKNMRGVDWRKKIKGYVEYFHETQHLRVPQLFDLIRSHDIHILINWDGYSNAGIRAGGIFALNPAPVQINHQEYIGTMGTDYIQYFISDNISSPKQYRKYYSEKFILMPHTFLATSMAYLQPDMQPPVKSTPQPEKNGCHGAPASFVYCNMNKHMKFTPDLVREWVKVMQNVPGSVLCLLNNPPQSEPFFRSFIDELDSTLQNRIRYTEFIVNPYDNQQRVKDLCNVALDTPVYSGHTTNADYLWGGVPVVSFGNSVDICGRVGHSMLHTLGLHSLIAKDINDYREIAIRLGRNRSFYVEQRNKLVGTCLKKTPPHPYWDMTRYTRNMEAGFEKAWERYLDQKDPAHIVVHEVFSPSDKNREEAPIAAIAQYDESNDEDSNSDIDVDNNSDKDDKKYKKRRQKKSISSKYSSKRDDESSNLKKSSRKKKSKKSRDKNEKKTLRRRKEL